MTDEELEKLKETVENSSNSISALTGKLLFFQEVLNESGLLKSKIQISDTDITYLCGPPSPVNIIRNEFVSTMTQFNIDRNS